MILAVCKWPGCTETREVKVYNPAQGILCARHKKMRQLTPVKRLYAHTPKDELAAALLKFETCEAAGYAPRAKKGKTDSLGFGWWTSPIEGCFGCVGIQGCRNTRHLWCRVSSKHHARLQQMIARIGDGV